MAKLNDETKLFIVQCLACFDTPTQVSEQVRDEFGLTIERPQIQAYDPTKVQGRALSKKLREVFEATRAAFLEDVSKIPIASQAFRLRSLQRMHDFYVSRKNYVAAQSVLEQAAKEAGGYYTNKVKVGGDAENPLTLWLQQLNGSALPVVHDVEGEFRQVEEDEPQPVNKKPPPRLMDRD